MSINAKWIKNAIQVKLPNDSSDLVFLENYLLSNGFKFNREIEKNECIYYDENKYPHKLYWYMKGVFNNNIICTFEGDNIAFPYEEAIRKIIYPIKLNCYYTITGNRKDVDEVIKTLFKCHFEVVAISKDGHKQVFKRKHNEIYLFNNDMNKFVMTFKGIDNVSRAILDSFQIS
jgi:hypothetical protein